MSVLRICRICGIEGTAKTVDELFYRNKLSKYGYRNICKDCSNAYRRKRAKEMGGSGDQIKNKRWIGQHESPIFCYFCEKEITELKGRNPKSFCLHSLDGNHDNWNEENKKAAHYGCHNHYHAFKGDDVTEHAKYMREWIARRRGYDYQVILP